MIAKKMLVGLILLTGVAGAQAESKEERTMLNAQRVSTQLDQVLPERIPVIVEKLANGQLKRVAPEQPLWILETIDGTILYYQGQPDFKNQPAAALIDDEGQRFGLAALKNAHNAKSSWISLTLGGTAYRAYCHVLSPFVSCSLMI